LQQEIRAKMIADAARFDPDEAAWISQKLGLRTKALGTIQDTAGGSLVRFPVLGELIELQRNMEVFAAAGAQEVALPPNGRLQFPKLTGGSTAYWVGEAGAITESTPSTGNLDLQAKKQAVTSNFRKLGTHKTVREMHASHGLHVFRRKACVSVRRSVRDECPAGVVSPPRREGLRSALVARGRCWHGDGVPLPAASR